MRWRQGISIVTSFIITILLTKCNFFSKYDTVNGTMRLLSVGKEETSPTNPITLSSLLKKSSEKYLAKGEHAGRLDLLKVKLKGVTFIMKGGEEFKALDEWESEALPLNFTGDGTPVNLSLPVPVGEIEKVKLFFEPFGVIKGSIPEKTYSSDNGNTKFTTAVYTKSKYYFNVLTGKMMETNGTLEDRSDDVEVVSTEIPDYTFYSTGPAEEALISMSMDSNFFYVETPLNITITEDNSPTINIVVDLSRMLHFSVKGYDLHEISSEEKKYPTFVWNHLLNYFFACFLGTTGRVEGYEYTCALTEDEMYGEETATGWLVLVFDANGSFAYGAMGPDNIGSGEPEGFLSDYNSVEGTFHVSKDSYTQFDISNFHELSEIGDSIITDITDRSTQWSIGYKKAKFTLRYQYKN